MQKLIQGEGALRQLESQVKAAGHASAFLVTGKHFQEQSEPGFLQDICAGQFIKSGPNVTDREITLAFAEYKKTSTPVIIAIGGGSVIDLAKAIIFECIRLAETVPFFIAAPTTAGSGSEATQFAVVYNNKKKISLVDPLLLPAIAILDPQLTYSLTAFQAAASGMDTLSQAIESYWSKQATEESELFAEQSIELWKQYFPGIIADPGPVSRERMLYASHLAGKAINITRTTGPHALSYYLTAEHHIAHGQAVAIFLPVFFIYNKPQDALCRVLGVQDEMEAKEFIGLIMKQAGLATRFAELGLDKHRIMNELLDSVNEERFTNNPEPFNKERLQDLFYEYL